MTESRFGAETLGVLTEHLDFEFDPTICSVSSRDYGFTPRFQSIVVSEVGERRYVEFAEERYNFPPYAGNLVDGVIDHELSDELDNKRWNNDDFAPKPDPDVGRDRTLHGLLNESTGHIALHTTLGVVGNLYRFHTVNGSGGVNKMSQTLGRTPGIDIPTFVPRRDKKGVNTAGEVTEAIADMKIFVPGADDFYMLKHDLGSYNGSHGPSWPHTPSAAYRQLSRVAQDVVEKHGAQIHSANAKERANRPPAVAMISSTLDSLINRLGPTIDSLTTMEIRVRDKRYDEVDDMDIAAAILHRAYSTARRWQHRTAYDFFALERGVSRRENYRKGYWIGMQLVAGAVETRLALHEVRPHPEATDGQTTRTQKILNSVKKEINRRMDDNRDCLLAA